MGAGEGKGRFRKAVAKTTLLRQMRSKVLPLTNPEARLSSEDLRRKKTGLDARADQAARHGPRAGY